VKELKIIGTAHVSPESVREVREAIIKYRPGVVALELDSERLDAILHKKKWEEKPITDMIKGNNSYFLLGYSLLSAFEQKIGEKTGARPGDELLAGYKAAKEVGAKVELIDRPIGVTLKRAWKKSSFKEKIKILWEFFGVAFGGGGDDLEITPELIESLKQEDVLTQAMEELSQIAPSAKKVFIDERDLYIAGKLKDLEKSPDAKKGVIAVIGKGHEKGVKKHLAEKTSVDFKALEEVPKKRFKTRWIFYGITFAIIAIFLYVGLNNPKNLPEYLFWWCIINIVFSAIGGIIALAHPLSIIAGALSSPITSLVPTIGAGWVGGIVEAKLRTPTVKDFNKLRDLGGIKDFWSNRFTHLLLVVALINVGSLIGTFVALPFLLSLF